MRPTGGQPAAEKKPKHEEAMAGTGVVDSNAGGAMNTEGSSSVQLCKSTSEGTDFITNMLKQCHFEKNARKEQNTARKEQEDKLHHEKWEAEQLQQNQGLGSIFLERRQKNARPTPDSIPTTGRPNHNTNVQNHEADDKNKDVKTSGSGTRTKWKLP